MSAERKCQELRQLSEQAGDNLIKSPFYNDVDSNPCIKEQNLSARCALEYNADRVKCLEVMENYTLCVRFWDMVKSERRWKNELPYLPPPEEREQFKAKYKQHLKAMAMDIISQRFRNGNMK